MHGDCRRRGEITKLQTCSGLVKAIAGGTIGTLNKEPDMGDDALTQYLDMLRAHDREQAESSAPRKASVYTFTMFLILTLKMFFALKPVDASFTVDS